MHLANAKVPKEESNSLNGTNPESVLMLASNALQYWYAPPRAEVTSNTSARIRGTPTLTYALGTRTLLLALSRPLPSNRRVAQERTVAEYYKHQCRAQLKAKSDEKE